MVPNPRDIGRRRSAAPPVLVVVLGDLVLDVVLTPASTLRRGTDVPGRVLVRQGGSAATTARWLARLGARATFICSIGRDAAGRALVAALAEDGVDVHALRVAGARTGRIGVLVEPGGERSFVADRGAADRLSPADLRAEWFTRAGALHLPAYSLLGRPLGEAGAAAVRMARQAGAIVTVDLASVGPLMADGRDAARALIGSAAPDLLFATAGEAEALLGSRRLTGLLELASVAVVKRGPKGATILARSQDDVLRFEVATASLSTTDTTGAGDAFDAGFLAAWLAARASGGSAATALQRAAVAGHQAAARHLSRPPGELDLA